nr:hypothetical protein [Tanacetum cinerariifolium]
MIHLREYERDGHGCSTRLRFFLEAVTDRHFPPGNSILFTSAYVGLVTVLYRVFRAKATAKERHTRR